MMLADLPPLPAITVTSPASGKPEVYYGSPDTPGTSNEALRRALDALPELPELAPPAGTVNLAWDASPTPAVGYKIYQSNSPFWPKAVNPIAYDAGTNLITSISGLYGLNYFVATAYDTSGLESDLSNEVSWQSTLSTVVQWRDATNAILAPPMALGFKQGQGGLTTTIDEQGRATFLFSVPLAGVYFGWCRTLGSDAGSDSFYISTDGGAEDIFDFSQANGQWSWSQLTGRTNAGPLLLDWTAGDHTIAIRGREAGAWLAGLYISNDPNWRPYPITSNVISFAVSILGGTSSDGPFIELTNLPAFSLTNPPGSQFIRAKVSITATNQ